MVPGPSRTSVNEHHPTALACDISKVRRSMHDRYDLDTAEVIARTASGRRPGPPATIPVGFRTRAVRHDLRWTMTVLPERWVLGGCSYVAIRAVTGRHSPAAEPAKSRTNRQRLTLRALIR
jgi:hypothetical protein